MYYGTFFAISFCLFPALLLFGVAWFPFLQHELPIAGRVEGYLFGLLFWFFAWFGFWGIYPVVDDLAWRTGYGDELTQRPWAAVHHRLLGLHDWLEDVSEQDDETAEKRAQAPKMLGSAAAVVFGSYLAGVVVPVETVAWLRRRRSRIPQAT